MVRNWHSGAPEIFSNTIGSDSLMQGKLLHPLFCLALIAAACGGNSPSSPSGAKPQSIQVGFAGNASGPAAPGQSIQLWALAVYKDGSSSDLTTTALWKSSSPAIATVSKSGLITTGAVGHADITASVAAVVGTLSLDVVGTCLFTVSPAHLIFGAFSTFSSVTVTPSSETCRWKAESDAAWLPFTFLPSVSGSATFSYAVPVNNLPEARSARIVITSADGGSAVHLVDQEKPVCSIIDSPAQSTIPSAGGSASFFVDVTPDDCHWNVFPNASSIRLTSQALDNVGDGAVTFTVTPPLLAGTVIDVLAIRNTSPGVHHRIVN